MAEEQGTGRISGGVGAEAFLELLNANDVRYIFINPGTDHVPILEAIAKFRSTGRQTPDTVLCLHESVAMSAAHGYFCVAEKPQVVLIHTDVGTMNIGAALHNAQRGMAGVVLCAGRVPWSPGNRDNISHFYQEQLDQAGIVRGFVKWDYELRSCADIQHVVQRAFQVANTEPHGPVYLVLPWEQLTEKVPEIPLSSGARFAAPATPQADAHLIDRAAKLLLEAQNPIAITSYSGRHHEAVAPLITLAETLGMRVISQDVRMNFPTVHPLWAGIAAEPYLKDADVILIIDHLVPYIPTAAQPKENAKIIYVDIDPLKVTCPLWQFPADIRIQADSSKVMPALNEAVSSALSPHDRARFQERFRSLQKEHDTRRLEWTKQAEAQAEKKPMSPEWLAYCIAREMGDDDIIINETISNWPTVSRHLRRSKPGTIFHTGGMGLGGGLGTALGVKLAAPERNVVCLVADGSFIFGEPIASLWAANRYHAPFLTIVFNNQGYLAVSRAVNRAYGHESYFQKRGKFEEAQFTPVTSYARIAQACGAWGAVIDDPAEVSPAIRNGLQRVRGGEPVVLEFKLEKPF